MSQEFTKQLKAFKEYMSDVEYLNSALSTLYWDARVSIPKKGMPYRGEVLGFLSSEMYKRQTSKMMKEFIDYFINNEEADDITKAMADRAKKEYDRSMLIPEERYRAYVIAVSDSEAAWEHAKEKADFSVFQPHLKKLISFNREFIGYWGYEDSKYDKLLDYYEPGITVKELDVIFAELKDAIIALLDRIKSSSSKPSNAFLKSDYPIDAQRKLCDAVLKNMGYDLEAGRVDVSVHPFTATLGHNDVRITTHYYEKEFQSALFSSIHEGGHAIYEQNISEELTGMMLKTGASMGIHESQSRLYENIIGRSRAFWTYFYPETQQLFPQFKTVPLDIFYKGINVVQPSLIRIEADELTYSLHIIIRYELEKAIFNGDVSAEELPALWNKKYKEYLGVEPQNDAEGILQDMHWSSGNFGYFPSYALGNLYGAQFMHALKKNMPDIAQRIAKGDLLSLNEWLKKNIHQHGAVYLPEELIEKVTGEKLTATYFIDYLNDKYRDIYGL
jgi:carboxypeptidase Taq